MVSDSIFNTSIPHPSKDLGKKKKANRSAKLKQCKLDARREQWLSQVRNKAVKDEGNGMVGGESNSPLSELGDKSGNHHCKEINYGVLHQEIDLESSATTTSPISNVSCGNDPGNGYNGSDTASSSGSSFGSGICCSGSFSGEEEGGDEENDEGCLDDWEAIADALAADDKPPEDSVTEKEATVQLDAHCERSKQGILGFSVEKSNSEDVSQGCRAAVNTKAWRVDDAFRPQSLPSLMKQMSFPMKSEKNCGHGISAWGFSQTLPPVPTACPICYEDLDFTDSSFLPCLCGFRLCLFCHKKILEGNGRCPGCRKAYELEAVQRQANVSEGSPTVRLARSFSMFSRA